MGSGRRESISTGAVRQRILEVARELFMTRGYRAVTTREIADLVGVTQPALYHHFGGKEELYTAVLEHELSVLSARMRRIFSRQDMSPVEQFEQIAIQLAMNAEHDMTQMFHDLRLEVSEQTQRRVGKAFFDTMVTPLVKMLGDMEAQGVIASGDNLDFSVHQRAFYVLGVVRVLSEGQHRSQSPIDRQLTPETIGRQAAHIILHGLTSAGGHSSTHS